MKALQMGSCGWIDLIKLHQLSGLVSWLFVHWTFLAGCGVLVVRHWNTLECLGACIPTGLFCIAYCVEFSYLFARMVVYILLYCLFDRYYLVQSTQLLQLLIINSSLDNRDTN